MRTLCFMFVFVLLAGCYNGGAGVRRPIPGQGQYQRPVYMQPELTRRMPDADLCRSQMYLGLLNQHEGGITFAYLPVRTRVVKPAEQELDQNDFLNDMRPQAPFVTVREYIPDQMLYGPSINAVVLADDLGEVREDRLTIELDKDGYVTALSCR